MNFVSVFLICYDNYWTWRFSIPIIKRNVSYKRSAGSFYFVFYSISSFYSIIFMTGIFFWASPKSVTKLFIVTTLCPACYFLHKAQMGPWNLQLFVKHIKLSASFSCSFFILHLGYMVLSTWLISETVRLVFIIFLLDCQKISGSFINLLYKVFVYILGDLLIQIILSKFMLK